MAKKYKLHKITEKEAAKIADQCEVPENRLDSDCYCLVNKKGKMYEHSGVATVFVSNAIGASEAEQGLKRAVEATIFFRDLAKENDVEFKIPKTADLLSGNLAGKKLKMPDNYNVEVVVNKDEDLDIFKKIDSIFEKIAALKDDIKNAEALSVDKDFDPYESEELDDYEDDDYDDDFDDYEDEDEEYDDEELDDDEIEQE